MTAQRIALAVVMVLALVAPLFVYPIFLMKALCFALFACAFNLLLGFTGLLSFGQGVFFGLGSYTIALTLTRWPLPMPLALLLAMVLGDNLGVNNGFLGFMCKFIKHIII